VEKMRGGAPASSLNFDSYKFEKKKNGGKTINWG